MPNSRARSDMASPSSRRATKRRRSSVTEHSFQGISTSRQKAESVTHVSGTFCHLCLGSLRAHGVGHGIIQRVRAEKPLRTKDIGKLQAGVYRRWVLRVTIAGK